ncbi:hypothetical protein TWF730_011217 [Orbilia blumenaviensis]|uniref:Uncharacterized protein n=1 Tax=Orbilia blumenaviensis TaxID=1796055 RepID=A0AAV9UQX4_9PEZI
MKFTTASAFLLSTALLTSAAPAMPLHTANSIQGLSSAVPRDIPSAGFVQFEKRDAPGEFSNIDVKWLNRFLNDLNGFMDGISRFFGGQGL